MIKTNKLQRISLFCAVLALVAGCGVKPRHVDPPASVVHDTFPQAYPPPSATPEGGRYLPPGYTPPAPRTTTTQDTRTP